MNVNDLRMDPDEPDGTEDVRESILRKLLRLGAISLASGYQPWGLTRSHIGRLPDVEERYEVTEVGRAAMKEKA